MIAVVSPSKDLDFLKPYHAIEATLPRCWDQSQAILTVMKKKKSKDLQKIMDISPKLGDLNYERYQQMTSEMTAANSRPCIFAFTGDVYRGLDALSLNKKELKYTCQHMRILSGLYGLLRPQDLIQAYRLEMGISIPISRKKSLYAFWKESITQLLNDDLSESKSKVLLNLASQEYAAAIDFTKIVTPVFEIHFRELRNGKLQFLSYNAKRARGLLVRYMSLTNAKSIDDVKTFNLENYQFDEKYSNEHSLFFIR
ncbi:MAG: peroxide stress protein YaaA [Saprospiraceae bacterium]|nr:peroxide stress protein YaaA [Saprospiraceae bacterium]MBK7812408.1 peroxide stress protein YaaA [Saprospiraceae bacterium]